MHDTCTAEVGARVATGTGLTFFSSKEKFSRVFQF